MNNIIKYFSDISDGNIALHIGDDEKKVIENREKLAKKLNKSLDDFIYMNQIHSGKSLVVSNTDKGKGSNKIDGDVICDSLVTNEKGIVLSVLVADCLPILFYDDVLNVVGVAHAGWRGTFEKVVKNTLENMKRLGSKIENIKVEIGPCISKNSYEVGNDVGNNFREEVKSSSVEGKQFLDLTKQNYLDLLDLGIKESNIKVLDIDTFTDKNYYSARMDGFNKGRFGGFIYIK